MVLAMTSWSNSALSMLASYGARDSGVMAMRGVVSLLTACCLQATQGVVCYRVVRRLGWC